MYDQQNGRLKYIGTLDRVETNNIAKRNKRMQNEKKNEIAEDINASKSDILINSAQNSSLRVRKQNVTVYHQHRKYELSFLQQH